MFKYGTIAFEYDFMEKTIGFGVPIFSQPFNEFVGFDSSADPNTLHLGVWLSFVPDAFKPVALRAAEKAQGFLHERVSEQIRLAVIQWMLADIDSQYKATRPRDWGRS